MANLASYWKACRCAKNFKPDEQWWYSEQGAIILEQHKILIVDDDLEIVDWIELYLTGEKYEILKAYDGKECAALLRDHEISLLVLDIMMPHIDGLTICKDLRERSNIPIILVTAKANPLDKVQGLTVGGWWLHYKTLSSFRAGCQNQGADAKIYTAES